MSDRFSLRCEPLPGKLQLHSGTYIVLFHATRIPPHLLIIHDGNFWDLSVKGNNCAQPLDSLWTFIERKNVPCLFIEWKSSYHDLPALLNSSFAAYEKIVPGETTCLNPIRDVVSIVHDEKIRTAGYIFELLPMLAEKKVLGRAYSVNIDQSFLKDGKFEILTYSGEELQDSIRAAQLRHS